MTIELQFLGAANTVTGSQFLLTTDRARILIDCGMFQGSPNESVRNHIPLAYDPHEVDALLLTHAHLDHCGLIPHLVREGLAGPILATPAAISRKPFSLTTRTRPSCSNTRCSSAMREPEMSASASCWKKWWR